MSTPRLLLALCFAIAAQAQRAIIIDTDAGSDDVMAIAFLLSQPAVHIEAITVANGLAHPQAGAENLVRLLDLAGRKDIPVFAGRDMPLQGKAEFPAEWRKLSDDLPGVSLPKASRPIERQPAADFLVARLRNADRPAQILALGPLTNIAEALSRDPASVRAIAEIVIMGGAVRVAGNLADGDVFKTNNKTAEWNIFVDPLAARVVFRSGAPIRLIPLDATNKVPVDPAFLRNFEASARTPLGRVVAQVLQADRKTIEDGIFYAWDPLAAVALLHPVAVKTVNLHIDILQDAPEEGRTVQTSGQPNASVAIDADAAAWRKLFLAAF